jgi:hypothetical protein
MLKQAFDYKWPGLYRQMKTIPNKQQIHRTLRELWQGGLIVGSRVKETDYTPLPYWVVQYQLSSDAEKNSLIADCYRTYTKVKTAKHGFNFFGSVMQQGLPPEEVQPLVLSVKRLMQKNHPDKLPGLEDQFEQMRQCHAWLKSGIPQPVPTQPANAKVN